MMMKSKLVYLIPLIAILYITYANLSLIYPDTSPISTVSYPDTYFIDVGINDTSGDATLQGPFERLSEPFNISNITYRLIEKDLVYFGIKVKQNFTRVKVESKFVDTIPEGYDLKIGLKNKKEWSYVWKKIYDPFYQSLEKFNITGEDSSYRIYSLNNDLTMPLSSFLGSPPDGVIANGIPETINNMPYVTYKESNSKISDLRGDHTFYVYTEGNLNISIEKQDMNWYDGSDALEIYLYSGANILIKNITIPDDGNTGKNSVRGIIQKRTIEAILDEGVYIITMKSSGDYLIRSFEINNGYIVVRNPFLAGISYTNSTNYNLYTQTTDGDRLGFLTYHAEGLQTVDISSNNYSRSINITTTGEWHYIDLPPGKELYQIKIPKGDIIINAKNYFSFSKEFYFNSLSIKTIKLQSSMEWLKENKVDYVIVTKQKFIKEGNWTIASTDFNISDAYIENNTLNFVISASHLQNSNYSIPLDWIKIYMEK